MPRGSEREREREKDAPLVRGSFPSPVDGEVTAPQKTPVERGASPPSSSFLLPFFPSFFPSLSPASAAHVLSLRWLEGREPAWTRRGSLLTQEEARRTGEGALLLGGDSPSEEGGNASQAGGGSGQQAIKAAGGGGPWGQGAGAAGGIWHCPHTPPLRSLPIYVYGRSEPPRRAQDSLTRAATIPQPRGPTPSAGLPTGVAGEACVHVPTCVYMCVHAHA